MENSNIAETEVPSRVYFNVVDRDGKVHPAVEYWAAAFEGDDVTSTQILPITRFVRLLGSKEGLIDVGDGAFKACRSGRTYMRESAPPAPAFEVATSLEGQCASG